MPSNAGSLLALLGYAFLVEPLLGVKAQSFTWTTGYIIYAIMVVAAWVALKPGKGAILFEPEEGLGSPARSGNTGQGLCPMAPA